jgi:hypothetical protein
VRDETVAALEALVDAEDNETDGGEGAERG